MQITCPHCEGSARTCEVLNCDRQSAEILVQCCNPYCSASGIALVSWSRTTIPSKAPSPEVDLPVREGRRPAGTKAKPLKLPDGVTLSRSRRRRWHFDLLERGEIIAHLRCSGNLWEAASARRPNEVVAKAVAEAGDVDLRGIPLMRNRTTKGAAAMLLAEIRNTGVDPPP